MTGAPHLLNISESNYVRALKNTIFGNNRCRQLMSYIKILMRYIERIERFNILIRQRNSQIDVVRIIQVY